MIGGELIHGQISTFMETLHLTYKEVWEVIPYQSLLMMQKDKVHEAHGDIIKRTTASEAFGDRIKR